jgi:hypothetical protein
MSRSLVMCAIVVTLASACRPPEAPPPPDVRVLLRTSHYDEAVAEAERLVAQERTIENLAVLATARAAQESNSGSSLEGATDALLQGMSLGSRGQVAQAFSEEVSGSMAFEGARFTGAATVLASLGQGWDAAADPNDAVMGAAALLSLGAYGGEHQGPPEAIDVLVTAASNLLEPATDNLAFPEGSLHWAWGCFSASGVIAGSVVQAGADQLSQRAAELCIRIAEANEQLAIAIGCDLGSPREQLRESLRRRHDVEALARLSNILASAEGCSPGAYAP